MNNCKIEGCENEVFAKNFCYKHYNQLRKYGKILTCSRSDKANHIEVVDNHAKIFLIDNKNNVCAKAIIDIEDIDKVKNIK